MLGHATRSNVAVLLTALALLLLAPADASAQAWVSEKGVLSGSGTYQFDTADALFETGGEMLEGTDTQVHLFLADVEYVPIDRLAVRAAVPLFLVKWTADPDNTMWPPHGPDDDGNLHAIVQDLRLDARYNVLDDPVYLTPVVGVSIPTHDYNVMGLAAAGRGLKQLHLGLNIARTFDPVVPNLFVHANYEFALVEKADAAPGIDEIGQNYSRYGVQVGYFLDRFQVFAAFNGLLYHDGLDFTESTSWSADEATHHDVLLKEKVTSVALGAGYQLSDRLSFSLTGNAVVAGANTRNAKQLALTCSWNLPVAATPPPPAEDDETAGADQ